ncbi:hypothetical protein POTOM_044364 [Populus tomentosa]|uniref:Uncharacterized protein n=1 Tax=Populus tomentosa TaxID=118781 RepID=A0A8X7YLN5_POPTO|nr:hypothetical protein POTOM_044364 [Populus tomentosa]
MDTAASQSPSSPSIMFYDFLYKMRNPASLNPVKSIKRVYVFQRYDRKHGLGLGRKEVVGYGMHKFPLKEIDLNQKWMQTGKKSFVLRSAEYDLEIDQEISEKIHFLQSFLRSEHLDIPAFLQNEASWLHDAINALILSVHGLRQIARNFVVLEFAVQKVPDISLL